MSNASLPLIAPVNVPIQPMPTEVAVAEMKNGTQLLIAMQLATANGVQFYFFDRDTAKQLGKMLLQLGSGLVVVGANEAPAPPRAG